MRRLRHWRERAEKSSSIWLSQEPAWGVGQPASLGGGQAVVEAAQRGGVEVVEHETDLLRLRVAGGQLLQELRELALGALLAHLIEAPAGQGLDRRQHAAGAVFTVGVGFLGQPGRLRGPAFDHVAEQKAGALVEANDGKTRVVGAGIEREQGAA